MSVGCAVSPICVQVASPFCKGVGCCTRVWFLVPLAHHSNLDGQDQEHREEGHHGQGATYANRAPGPPCAATVFKEALPKVVWCRTGSCVGRSRWSDRCTCRGWYVCLRRRRRVWLDRHRSPVCGPWVWHGSHFSPASGRPDGRASRGSWSGRCVCCDWCAYAYWAWYDAHSSPACG